MSASTRPLGRNLPAHYDHVEKYALAPEATPRVQPVAPGFNWYTSFDAPTKGSDGRYHLPSRNLGTIRGGHCVCLCPPSMLSAENEALHHFYNQGEEGACEGFGHARRFSLLFRETFDAFHLYDDGQRIEGTFVPEGGSADQGSTNDAICQALRKWGVHTQGGTVAHRTHRPAAHPKMVTSYRWATTADQVLKALGETSGSAIPLLNSWGDDYPDVVYLPPETLERLLREGGECDVLTDA